MRIKMLVPLVLAIAATSGLAADRFPIDATTEDGKTVTLHEDGTWRPRATDPEQLKFGKGELATQRHASRLKFFELWVDPKVWKLGKSEGDHEFNFEHNSGEAWCSVIPERIQMTQEGLATAALTNFREVDPKATMGRRYKASVSGVEGEVVEMSGASSGYLITFHSLLLTGRHGSVQLSCWTSPNLLEEYRRTFDEFFGGYVLVR